MKKNEDKANKIVSILNYFTSLCFYIVSIINFIDSDNTLGLIYLCLGSTFLCLGSVWLNKSKKK